MARILVLLCAFTYAAPAQGVRDRALRAIALESRPSYPLCYGPNNDLQPRRFDSLYESYTIVDGPDPLAVR